ncbi:MAG: hypothetical protein AB1554_11360 [Chloroflexota bacterium]
MKRIILALLVLAFATLACEGGASTPFPTPESSVFDSGRTVYGFFPSPPEVSLESIIQHFKDMGEHGDFVLIQQNTDWAGFANGVDGESQSRTDLKNQVTLARQNNIGCIFVLDPLNGLNRREFVNLPAGWDANFANPDIRSAHKNYALWIIRNFHPRYLGLASEINTYMDAHPDDAQNFISLYNEIYALVKAEAPEIQIFVTFQWDDLNNMWTQPEEGDWQRLSPNWEQVEAFEPNLDLWAISTYPYFVFTDGNIPADYYTPLLSRTSKPLAVAEGGFSTQAVGPINGSPDAQVAYLNAIHDQLGPRLVFWVNLLLTDFNLQSYAEYLPSKGQSERDLETLGYFAYTGLRQFDGTPKPALEIWDSYRSEN